MIQGTFRTKIWRPKYFTSQAISKKETRKYVTDVDYVQNKIIKKKFRWPGMIKIAWRFKSAFMIKIISSCPENIPVIFLFLCSSWGNGGRQRQSILPKVTWLINRVSTQTQTLFIPRPLDVPLCHKNASMADYNSDLWDRISNLLLFPSFSL